MSLHFHDSLFAHFSFAQGKSIRCLCFAQLRTSFRLADNVASLADVRRATRQCRPAPFAIEASTGCTSGSLLAARHSGRFRRAVRSIARIHHEFIYFSSIYLFFVERCPIERRTNRWLSNFDQFFVGLPISLYERPHRTSVGPRLAADVVRLVPVFPPGNVSQPPTLSWDASASNRSNGGSAQIR
jgi:hypothetical protein